MTTIYYDKDATLEALRDKTVAIIRYARFGVANAQNLKDSGIRVIVGDDEGTARFNKAVDDGFETMSVSEAAKQADVLAFVTAYEQQATIYHSQVKDHMKEGACLLFAHGYAIRYRQIIAPPTVDVVMVAPKAPSNHVRNMFLEGIGTPALVAVEQNASGEALAIALAFAKANGFLRAGAIETTFAEETETDLFGEQAVFCGPIAEIIRYAFEILTAEGYTPEVAYFECLHEVKMIVDLIHDGGIEWMRECVSETAAYGGLVSGKYIIDDSVRQRMVDVLKNIKNGKFAHEWSTENIIGNPIFYSLAHEEKNEPLAVLGQKIRSMMPWIEKKPL